MKPYMTENECMLFLAFVRNSHKYLEFGCGGSTVLASCYVKKWIITVDSSEEWMEKVEKEKGTTTIIYNHVDIGSIGKWGTPIDLNAKDKWVDYYSRVWNFTNARLADLCLFDGRFRVACAAEIYLRCKKDTIIGIHDFASRHRNYGIVEEFLRQIAFCDDISFFSLIPNKRSIVLKILKEYKHNWR